jgi:pyridoxamine 5'-phosphate oxidase
MKNESLLDFASMRLDYQRGKLHRADLDANPIVQFNLWMSEACEAGLVEPTAMSLATVNPEGRPLVRTVLLKGLDTRGFVFFTNLESRKAQHLARNPHASLLFAWLPLERQVIVSGKAFQLSSSDVLRYFLTRPRDSQISAWASHQSSVITSRKFLEMEWERMKAKFVNRQIPLPSFWGGYCVQPETIEFWQGRTNRLHDRFEYAHQPDGSWTLSRLAP